MESRLDRLGLVGAAEVPWGTLGACIIYLVFRGPNRVHEHMIEFSFLSEHEVLF